MTNTLNRRSVLKTAASAAAGVALNPSCSFGHSTSPSEKLNLGFIGVGGRGTANVEALATQNMVAFADVDDHRAGKMYERFQTVQRFTDYRKLLDEHGSKLDGIVISTPDHMHFHPAWAAMQLGLHVYLEKPLAHDVKETRTLTDYVHANGLATQLGAQRHANPNMHRVVEIIQAGIIGDVTEVHSWVKGDRGMPDIPKDRPSVPKHLDYDLWIGPANYRPYHPSFCPYGWRFWWDYGSGETGNWGCHMLDIPFWALNMKYPDTVSASGPPADVERSPKSMHVTYSFPARGELNPVRLHWYHGVPKIAKPHIGKEKHHNTLFIGSKGMLLCGFNHHKLLPEAEFANTVAPARTIPDSPGFHDEWVMACRGEQAATCNFDYSGPLAEAVLLGNVAYRAGGFTWDAEKLSTGKNEKAQVLLQTEYRKGWGL